MLPRLVLLGVLVGFGACGGGGSGSGSPTAPSSQPAPPPAASSLWSLSGVLVDALTGQPVPGASLTFNGGAPITTSPDGRWRLEGAATAAEQAVVISVPGFVTRETLVRGDRAGRTDVRLDLISERAPFGLDFYRQFARDALDTPASLRPIRRWMQAPSFYVDITNPRNGGQLTPSEIALVEQVLRTAVPQLTGGLKAGIIETGVGPSAPRSGYITVTFVSEPNADFCGWAYVGANPGEIVMNYERCVSGCGRFAPETLAHEVGHALGFFHTSGPGIMHADRRRRCENLDFSDEERAHARIVYGRPNGNQDLDRDPSGFTAIEGDLPPGVVVCSG